MKSASPKILSSAWIASVLLIAVIDVASPAPPGEMNLSSGERQELSLNGKWDMATAVDPAYPPRVNEWRSAEIPVMAESNAIQGTRYVWYRKEVLVPDSFKGKRIDLLLYGARYNAAVYCNGTFVASRLEGFTPFYTDLTDRLKPGESFLLEIRCQDWSAVFKDGYQLPTDADPNWDTLRGVPQGRLVAPIGGILGWFGIWDDVALLARPHAHCEDVAINTSVRNANNITVTGEIVGGRPGFWIEGAVYDGDKKVLPLPGQEPTPDGKFKLSAEFPKPRYWSPEDPHQYVLTLVLKDRPPGAELDRYQERFGFRELWAVGPDFYFNGVKRHLLASSGWPTPRYQGTDEIKQALANIKASNAVAFRFHTQPWQHRWIELADEAGLLIVEEGALWCDGGGGYAYGDERFWENVWTHLSGMVRRDRNHPCLVMWSVENELLHCGASRHCACAEARLAEVGRKVKALDPTHLITYEADHDPGGAADVIGLHYPREMPENTDYPNTADWLGTTVTTGTAGGTAGSWNKDFFWERKKPLYIGEYLGLFYQDYSPGSVFFGDEAYLDRGKNQELARARAWEIQTVAYRRGGVSGMCPWTIADEGGRINVASPFFAAQKKAYEPVAVFPQEFDTRFFTGEKVTRSFDVFNDSVEAKKIEVRVSLEGWAAGYAESFLLEPAGHKVVTVTVKLPEKPAPAGLSFNAGLYIDGKKIHFFDTRFLVYEKQPLLSPAGISLLVFDPNGKFLDTAEKAGVKELKKLDELPQSDPAKSILIVGPYAFADKRTKTVIPVIGVENTDALFFRRFLENGGRALVLEQETFAGIMPELSLVSHSSTMTFPVSMKHPLLAGLDGEAFKFWRGDHRVTWKEIRRPVRLGAKALLVSGGLSTLDQAPLVEINVGKGKAIFCQALAGTKFGTEPAARRLIGNAVTYLSTFAGNSQTALLAEGEKDGAAFRKRLDELGIAYAPLPERPTVADLEKSGLLIFQGGGKKIEALAPLLESLAKGNTPLTIYWHAPEKESFDKLKTSLGLEETTIVPAVGPLSLLEKNDPVLDGVLREDLCFLKPFAPSNWYREVDSDLTVIDRALDILSPQKAQDRHEVEAWNLTGTFVQLTENGQAVAFYTNGTAQGEINVAREGLYKLSLAAWGTSAEGDWPAVLVKADGRPVAQVSVAGKEKQSWPFLVRLPSGRVKLELSFINDLCRNGEDRNVFIDALLVDREPIAFSGFTIFSLPPALAAAVPSSHLRVVLDCVRWDTNASNRVKGFRFASTLFANLGSSFLVPERNPEWIDPPAFEPTGSISVFSRADTELSLASAGTVRSTFSCAAAGEYTIILRGYSSPAKGVYAKALVRVDGKKIGEPELDSSIPAEFKAGEAYLEAGDHELTVEFTNDLWLGQGREDRNLYLMGAAFLPVR